MADKLLEIKGVSKIFRVGGMIRGKKLVAVDDVTLSIDNDKPVIRWRIRLRQVHTV